MKHCSITLIIIVKVIIVQINDGYGDIYSTYNHCLFQRKVNVLGSLERA